MSERSDAAEVRRDVPRGDRVDANLGGEFEREAFRESHDRVLCRDVEHAAERGTETRDRCREDVATAPRAQRRQRRLRTEHVALYVDPDQFVERRREFVAGNVGDREAEARRSPCNED